jgi:dUTPase
VVRDVVAAFGSDVELVAFAVTVTAKQTGRVRIELPRQPSRTWDLYAAIDKPAEIVGGARLRVPTGWAFGVPEGFEVQAISRPELALEHGVTVLAYEQGEPFAVVLHNRDRRPFVVQPRTRIARAVVVPVAVVRGFEEIKT